MNALINALHDYCLAHSDAPPPVLTQLERETHLKTLAPQMISGPLQGRFLALLSRLIQPKRILEIGTFTGYSSICLAEGLAKDGQLIAIEGNPELAHIIEKYIEEANLTGQVNLKIGDAKTIIPTIDELFDLVFIDANKREYSIYFDLIADKIRPGGLMIADNVLWSGKVVQAQQDKDTALIDEFNKKVLADDRFSCVMLPLRDGLFIAQRI